MLDGKKSTAERIVYDAMAILGERTGKDPVEALENSIKILNPVLEVKCHPGAGALPGGQAPPRRRRDLPGPRRGPAAPRAHPRRPLARRVRAPAPREDDG